MELTESGGVTYLGFGLLPELLEIGNQISMLWGIVTGWRSGRIQVIL